MELFIFNYFLNFSFILLSLPSLCLSAFLCLSVSVCHCFSPSLHPYVHPFAHPYISALSQLSESEETARRFSALCNDRKIPFFRFNPDLFEVIATGETNDEKLVNMMLQTRIYLQELNTSEEMVRMVTLLKHLSMLHCARAKPQH